MTPPDPVQELLAASSEIAQSITEGQLDEAEVVARFFQAGFFSALGYGAAGQDIRLESRVGTRRADVILRSFTGRTVGLLEFKRPGVQLADHTPQLQDYAARLHPQVAVLTNGSDFWTFRPNAAGQLGDATHRRLNHLTEAEANELYQLLRRREVDLTNLPDVQAAIEQCLANPIQVDHPDQPGGRQFLQRFELHRHSPFGRLTTALADALPELIGSSTFAEGAFAFWRRVYAPDLDTSETPTNWRPLLRGDTEVDLLHFTFALETAYALLSRAILAKAMADAGFPHLDASRAFRRSLESQQTRGRLALTAFVAAPREVFSEASRQAFQSLFASDIFDWWEDAHRLTEPQAVSSSMAEAMLAVFEFDFSDLAGDLLGSLYQSYFDPETRKALGEFYTPPEIVDLILDEVGYQGPHVAEQRLLDPSCGSGTFLIHALRRYIASGQAAGHHPAETLRQLIHGLRVVGFDVNPFAVLMAQINYAAQILPLYAQVIQNDPNFALMGVPVFRTDSLRREQRESEQEDVQPEVLGDHAQLGLTLHYATGGVARIRTHLPVRATQNEFLQIDIPVPQFGEARDQQLVDNVEEYFAVLRETFAAVRDDQVAQEALRRRFVAAGFRYSAELAAYVLDAATQIASTMERLRNEYQDGRFLKTLEDLALALILKNDLRFDYVVGNPPYVRSQAIPDLLRHYWSGQYSWPSGDFDIYVPFFERSLTEWLADDGLVGFICSDRFLFASYAEALRRETPSIADLLLLIDFRVSTVFRDADNSPAVIIMRKHSRGTPAVDPFPAVRFISKLGEEEVRRRIADIRNAVRQVRAQSQHVVEADFDAFPVSSDLLTEQAWLLMPVGEREVFDELSAAGGWRLGELSPVAGHATFQGLATGDDPSLVLEFMEDRGETLLLRPRGSRDAGWTGPPTCEIEKTLLRRWVFGRDVERWRIGWDGWYVFFPYAQIEALERRGDVDIAVTRYRLIPTSATRDRFVRRDRYQGDFPLIDVNYQNAWRYVTNPYVEGRLRRREQGARAANASRGYRWYELGRPQNLEHFERQKILVQVASPSADFAMDEGVGYVLQHGGRGGGTDGIILKPDYDPWLILGLLNSGPLDFFLRHVSPVFNASGSYSYSDAFLKQLPLRLPTGQLNQQLADEVARLAEQLTRTTESLRLKENELAAFPQPFIPDLGRVDTYRARRWLAGNQYPRTLRIEAADYQPELDGQWRVRLGQVALRVPSRAHADVLMTRLRLTGRRTMPFESFLDTRVPATQQACRRLIELAEQHEREVNRLRTEVEGYEAALNQAVARFYGLRDTSVATIGDFLSRF